MFGLKGLDKIERKGKKDAGYQQAFSPFSCTVLKTLGWHSSGESKSEINNLNNLRKKIDTIIYDEQAQMKKPNDEQVHG